MLQIALTTTQKVSGLLASTAGIASALAQLNAEQEYGLADITPQQIIAQNVAFELSDRSGSGKYPLLCVYCSKIVNELREKFRTFSGVAEMVIEARVSQDRLEDTERNLQGYVDAILQVLNQNRGDWDDGVFYTGGYEVTFGGLKHGGRNFLQIAKVTFTLEISAD